MATNWTHYQIAKNSKPLEKSIDKLINAAPLNAEQQKLLAGLMVMSGDYDAEEIAFMMDYVGKKD